MNSIEVLEDMLDSLTADHIVVRKKEHSRPISKHQELQGNQIIALTEAIKSLRSDSKWFGLIDDLALELGIYGKESAEQRNFDILYQRRVLRAAIKEVQSRKADQVERIREYISTEWEKIAETKVRDHLNDFGQGKALGLYEMKLFIDSLDDQS